MGGETGKSDEPMNSAGRVKLEFLKVGENVLSRMSNPIRGILSQIHIERCFQRLGRVTGQNGEEIADGVKLLNAHHKNATFQRRVLLSHGEYRYEVNGKCETRV